MEEMLALGRNEGGWYHHETKGGYYDPETKGGKFRTSLEFLYFWKCFIVL
jgi:hypothetical protein